MPKLSVALSLVISIMSALPGLSLRTTASALSRAWPTGDRLLPADADGALMHLATEMDQFHTSFDVYTDIGSAGNHFVALAKIGDLSSVDIDPCSTESVHSGLTSIKNTFRNTTGNNFGGWYFLNGVLNGSDVQPSLNFGDAPNAGVDLSGATQLTFWARGASGGENVEFLMGGVGRSASSGVPTSPYPDSTPRIPPAGTITTLTTTWTMYTIELIGAADLSYILGGFAWVCTARNNPAGAVFYLDDISYNKSRPNDPRFIVSYVTNSPQPIDVVNRNAALTYDNALAILAFLSRGTDDDVRRSKLIGDAFVYALMHDRTYSDGRLRNAYQAGDLVLPPGWTPNGKVGTVRMPSIVTCDGQPASEDAFQVSSSTNSVAWTVIALLRLYQKTGGNGYLSAAQQMGEWIEARRQNAGKGGYRSGFEGFDKPSPAFPNDPVEAPGANTLDNLAVFGAFNLLQQVTQDSKYQGRAGHALDFITAMYEPNQKCLREGTLDASTITTDVLILANQALGVLAVPDSPTRFPSLIQCAETYNKANRDNFVGFDYNEDDDGIWFEGTAMMALAYAKGGQSSKSTDVTAQLRAAQSSIPGGNGKGIMEASHDGVTTGFVDTRTKLPVLLYRRLRVAPTAWYVLLESGMDPLPFPPSAAPMISSVKRVGKNLMVNGSNFDAGAVILLNGDPQRTLSDDQNPTTVLIGRKVGKRINPGDKVKVRNSDGNESNEVTYMPTS
jgi:hypothetical protein